MAWRRLAAVIAVVTSGALPAFLVGAVGVQVRSSLGFGEARLGLLVGVFFLSAACCSAVFGRLAERLGPSLAMRLAAIASGSTLLAVAVLGRSWSWLAVLLVLGGAANALAQPAANVFIARTVAGPRLGFAFALKQSGVPASTLLGGLAVPAFALTVGWRWAFVAGALLAFVAALVVPSVGAATATSGFGEISDRNPTAHLSKTPQVSYRPLLMLAVGIGLGAAAAGTLGAFLTNAAVDAGLDAGLSGLLVSAGSAFGIGVRLVVGARADRRGGGHLRVVTMMLVFGAVGYACYSTEIPWLLVVATPLAFGAGWGWPGLFNLAVVRENPHAPGLASGVTQTGTYLGAVIGPVVFGAIAESSGYRVAWLVASAAAVAAAIAMWAGRSMVRRARRLAVPV